MVLEKIKEQSKQKVTVRRIFIWVLMLPVLYPFNSIYLYLFVIFFLLGMESDFIISLIINRGKKHDTKK